MSSRSSFFSRFFETKVVVSLAVFGTLCVRRDVTTTALILGAIVNALLSKVLKRIINASRPPGAQLADPGMPSSHAQSLFFFASYLGVGTHYWPVADPHDGRLPRAMAATLILTVAALLTLLRVRAGLHTMAQITVGAAIGGTNGACFYYLSPTFERALVRATPESYGTAFTVALLVLGALVVGSVERTVASRLKSRRS